MIIVKNYFGRQTGVAITDDFLANPDEVPNATLGSGNQLLGFEWLIEY